MSRTNAASLLRRYRREVRLSAPRLALCDGPPPSSVVSAENQRYLGCSIRALESGAGMIVLIVNSGSPAEASGIKRGDVILEIEGQKIQNIGDYRTATAPGGKLSFKVMREREELKIDVTL